MPRLSAIIIALNEAGKIAGCLDALSFCDERIVVVDGGSSDETARIAQGAGARVLTHPFEGFGAQKGFALSQATGDWVLSIDADERVSPALAQEIKAALASGAADGYELPRRSAFCGRLMDHSGWARDYVLRLFNGDIGIALAICVALAGVADCGTFVASSRAEGRPAPASGRRLPAAPGRQAGPARAAPEHGVCGRPVEPALGQAGDR